MPPSPGWWQISPPAIPGRRISPIGRAALDAIALAGDDDALFGIRTAAPWGDDLHGSTWPVRFVPAHRVSRESDRNRCRPPPTVVDCGLGPAEPEASGVPDHCRLLGRCS